MKVFVLMDDYTPRLSPALAAEIGLTESLLLLQFEYWIDKGGHLREDRMWTKQSLGDLQAQFPFVSEQTINRAIHQLIKLKLIEVTSKYNRWKRDRSRWFSINETGCQALKSIKVLRVTVSQNEKAISQNEPTLPQTTAQKIQLSRDDALTGEDRSRDRDAEIDDMFEQWAFGVEDQLAQQPVLSPVFLPKVRKPLSSDPIPSNLHGTLYRICYMAETKQEALLLNATQRGKVANALGMLRDAKADFNRLALFEQWWESNWRSSDKSGTYQAPRPEQIVELWHEAMKSGSKVKIVKKIEAPEPERKPVDIEAIMTRRALQRNGKI
jgi:hypothetical protein